MGYIASFECRLVIGGKLCANHIDVMVIPDEVFQSIGNGSVHNYGSPRELNEAADAFVHNTLGITNVDWRGCMLWRQSVDATQYSAALANMYAIVPTVYDVGLTLEDNTYVNGTGTNKNGTYPLGCFQRRNYGTYLAEGSLGTTTGAQNTPKNAISGSNPRVAVERDGSFDITIPIISDYSFVDGKLDFSKIAERGSGRFTVGYNSSYTSNPWIWRCQTKISAGATNFTTWDGYPLFNEAKPHEMGTPYDPYEPGGYTDPSGEDGPSEGEFELPQDELAVGGSSYNDLSAGLYRAYAMTASQLTDFSDQLWNTDILDALSRYMQNPADLVLSLMSFPFDVDAASAATQIGFNWLSAWNLSSIVASGYRIEDGHNQHISFGYIQIPQYSGTFYDYGPYSSVEVHLPYIGFVTLKMNEVVGRKIYVDYYVDIMTGDFTAHLSVGGSELNPEGLPLMAVYQGNIAKPLPLTQQNMWQVYKKIGETAVAAIVAGAGAGVGAQSAIEADRYAALASTYDKGSPEANEYNELSDSYSRGAKGAFKTAKRFAIGGVANSIINMQAVNAPIVRNGSVDGSNGRTSSQECFAIVSIPDQNVPENQQILGFPSNIPGPLSKVKGYTEVREIRLQSALANNSELAEIEEIVRGGIII